MKQFILKKAIIWSSLIWTLLFASIALADWELTIDAQGKDMIGMYKSQVTIGVSDQEKTTEAAPLPPDFSCHTYIASQDWMTAYAKHTQTHQSNLNAWVIAVNPHGNVGNPMDSSCSLTWTLDKLDSGHLSLHQGWSMDGETLIEDMTQNHSFTVSGGNSYQYFVIVYQP